VVESGRGFRESMPPMIPFTRIAVVLLLATLTPVAGQDQEETTAQIRPPFGVYWGLPQENLEKSLEAVQARIIERKTVNDRKALVVEGLIHPRLLRAVFYFTEEGLAEVELQYGAEEWDGAQYANYFDTMRRSLERKYGTSKLITRSKKNEGAVMTTLIGYQWAQLGCLLQIYYFSADQGADSFRLVSVHYRGI